MPVTVPAARTLLIALQQAAEIARRDRQAILNAAVEDSPSLTGATLDIERGEWSIPDRVTP